MADTGHVSRCAGDRNRLLLHTVPLAPTAKTLTQTTNRLAGTMNYVVATVTNLMATTRLLVATTNHLTATTNGVTLGIAVVTVREISLTRGVVGDIRRMDGRAPNTDRRT